MSSYFTVHFQNMSADTCRISAEFSEIFQKQHSKLMTTFSFCNDYPPISAKFGIYRQYFKRNFEEPSKTSCFLLFFKYCDDISGTLQKRARCVKRLMHSRNFSSLLLLCLPSLPYPASNGALEIHCVIGIICIINQTLPSSWEKKCPQGATADI